MCQPGNRVFSSVRETAQSKAELPALYLQVLALVPLLRLTNGDGFCRLQGRTAPKNRVNAWQAGCARGLQRRPHLWPSLPDGDLARDLDLKQAARGAEWCEWRRLCIVSCRHCCASNSGEQHQQQQGGLTVGRHDSWGGEDQRNASVA